MKSFVIRLSIPYTLFVHIVLAQDLPYNPSRILLSPRRNDIAYIFLPSSATLESKLLSLNLSTSINTSNLEFETITAELPFVSESPQAFLPIIDDQDGISIYTGDCAPGASGSSLWKFTPGSGNAGNGTWSKSTFEISSDFDSADLSGANYLSSGFAFSTLLAETSSLGSVYIFGGMCPTAPNANESTWQASANYSNNMLQFSPNTATEYSLGLASLSSPPISEAGFSLTPLQATMSKSSSGTMTQQQNFILLGGHTQNAFTNFSQVAILSLPQEAWSFETIDSPRDSLIDSRSGHTAVLTEDGSKIVVFGGWVGNISTSAIPQLAILELGAGFGGSGDWAWTFPDSGNGIADGTGIYGHGSAMLPGNVMMVLGGYTISSSSTSSKRATINSEAYFFNATSMTWVNDYKNPASTTTTPAEPATSTASTTSGGSSPSTAKEVGLGVGLSCGFAAIIIAGLAYLWYSRRLKRQRRNTREKGLRVLSYGAATYCSVNPNNDPFAGQDVAHASSYYNYNNAYLTDNVSGYENLQNHSYTNAESDFDLMSPISDNTRNSAFKGKGNYQLAPSFDTRGRSNSLRAGPIHPIIEADEDEHPFTLAGVGPESDPDSPGPSYRRNSIIVAKRKPVSRPGTAGTIQDGLRSHPISLHNAPLDNSGGPSTDRSSSNPSPESLITDPAIAAAEREAEIREWVNDWAAADALLDTQSQMQSHSSAYAGRLTSPPRYRRPVGINATDENACSGDGRTESNLSESARSAFSNLTMNVGRSISQRSTSLGTFLTGGTTMNTFTSSSPTAISPTFDRSYSVYEDLRSPNGGYQNRHDHDHSGTSFSTALTHHSFRALRAEGESLLPRPLKDEAFVAPVEQRDESPSKLKEGVRSVSWLGSLRRVLTGSGHEAEKKKLESEGPMYWSDADSPTRGPRGAAGNELPRRTVSAGATLWRRKQGKADWEDSEPNPTRSNNSPTRASRGLDDPFTSAAENKEMGLGNRSRGSGQATDDDEWDIERAVENRVVQVMFTVPKERLRVVNYDIEEDISEVDQGSVRSRSENLEKLAEISRVNDNRSPGRVREMVEKFEGRASPASSPVRGKMR